MGYSQAQLHRRCQPNRHRKHHPRCESHATANRLDHLAGKLATISAPINLRLESTTSWAAAPSSQPRSSMAQRFGKPQIPYQTGAPDRLGHHSLQLSRHSGRHLPGAATQTFNSDDIYGHRLSIFFDASYVPTLYLDGSAVVSGSASSQGSQLGIDFELRSPGRRSPINPAPNTLVQRPIRTEATAATSFKQAGTKSARHGGETSQVADSSYHQRRGAQFGTRFGRNTLSLGLHVARGNGRQQRLSDQLLGTATQYFYGGGIVGEAVGSLRSAALMWICR